MGDDILHEVNRKNIPEVLRSLKQDWPTSIHIYYFTWIHLKWLNCNPNMKSIKVYRCGKPGEELFLVSVHYKIKEIMINRIMVYSQIKDDRKVKKLLLDTDAIDWSSLLEFEAVIEKDIPVIQEICKIKNKPCFSDGLFNQVWLPPHKQQSINITMPSDVCVQQLTEENVPRVNDTWRYKFPGSEQLARDPIIFNIGLGLFRKSDNKLLAWTLMGHFAALYMLYTEEDERGKGYGALISLAMAKYLVDNEIDPYACIKLDNVASFSVFKKLGFEMVVKVSWLWTYKINDVLQSS